MIFQTAAAVAGGAAPHPLSGTAADWVWALPLLPLLGFVLNGALAIAGSAKVGPADPSAGGHDGTRHDAAHGASPGDGEADDGHGDAAHAAPHRHPYAGLVECDRPARAHRGLRPGVHDLCGHGGRAARHTPSSSGTSRGCRSAISRSMPRFSSTSCRW